ncbi:MAG TPA: serine/threonine protein kinase, partial [Candidatus Nanopusillus sp.]|nr:serine/threonine protein kinase [Candidatus Nanopusillus sp.]
NLLDRDRNISLEDLSYSIQEHIFAMLTEIVERAVAHLNKKEVGLTGGVAANRRLQSMLKSMCEERKIKFGTVPLDFANDNGAMISWTGILWFKKSVKGINTIDPYWRPEGIEITDT